MSYTLDKSELLSEAGKKGYAARKAELQAQGVETKQHNSKVTKAEAKKEPAKKTASAKPAEKKPAAKKTTAKKAAKKS